MRMSISIQSRLPEWFAVTLSALSFAAIANPRAAEHQDSLDSAFRLVRAAVEKDEVPGAVALVARGGTILRHESYGLRDLEHLHEGSSGTFAWADPRSGVIGILFLQYRDRNESDVQLRNRFRQAVCEAFAERERESSGDASAHYFPPPESQGG